MVEFIDVMVYAGIALLGLVTVGMILAKLYRRASKEISFVRTGFGGQGVIMNGGALVLPVLHEVIPVNMNTLRLEVRRANQQALITRDRMRVDVLAEFYVRVQPTEESIANAAQTLGMRTMEPDRLKELVEGKFVDALRAVAAEMAMTELHEQRVDFVQKVQQVVSEDLLKNGLELESVSLTGLDQTSREFFNPDNAFDAEGLTKLTEEIEVRRKRRNDIEQDTLVEIQRKNLEADRQKLELSKEEEYARLQQEREIAVRKAEQAAEIAREEAEKQQEAEQAKISAKQQVDLTNIEAQRAVEEERIEVDRQIKEKEILKNKVLDSAQIEKQKAIELAEQDRSIAIAEKSKEQSEAKAQADQAKATAVQAEERVITTREKEQAERQKLIELVEAAKEAEREAIGVTVAAEAEKKAAEDKAQAVRIFADAEAQKRRIVAQGEADAEILSVQAAEQRYAVEATGKRALNEAANLLSNEQIAMQVRLAIVQQLPNIIRESVRPMEKIDGIKIMQVEGLNSGNHNGQGEPTMQVNGNLADQVVNSALRYRAQAPIVESLLQEIGLNGSDLNGLTQGLREPPPESASD
jgi:uncharacterized membrane protein YqiK